MDTCSVRGFVIGFGLVLGGELEDLVRGDDLRLGRMQDRILAVCLPGRKGWRIGVVADRISVRAQEQRGFLDPGASRLTPWDRIGDPRFCLGEYPTAGWLQVVESGVVDAGWFDRAQRFDSLIGVAAS